MRHIALNLFGFGCARRDCDTAHTHTHIQPHGRGTHSTNSTNSHLFLHFANGSTNTLLCSVPCNAENGKKNYATKQIHIAPLPHTHSPSLARTHTHPHALESVPQASKSNAMCQRTTAISMLHNAAAHFPFNLRDPVKCAHHIPASTESFAGTKPVHTTHTHTHTQTPRFEMLESFLCFVQMKNWKPLLCWWLMAVCW